MFLWEGLDFGCAMSAQVDLRSVEEGLAGLAVSAVAGVAHLGQDVMAAGYQVHVNRASSCPLMIRREVHRRTVMFSAAFLEE